MKSMRVYLATAVCACHINMRSNGFRQKDVHFYFDLFVNWMEASLGKFDLQNIQIQRYLEKLVKNQILKKTNKLVYTCQDTGLIPLLTEITSINDDDPMELFFFQYHILRIYHERLFESVVDKKLHLPHNLKIDLKYILDKDVIIQKQKTRICREIDKLILRSRETLGMENLADSMFKDGKNDMTIVESIEKKFPYQLHHQKKMSELYYKLDPALRRDELTTNAKQRVNLLWTPLINYYQDYLLRLDTLNQSK